MHVETSAAAPGSRAELALAPPPSTGYGYVHSPQMKLDFSPLFLALIPIALALGAASSFALSTAVRSNAAVASAQQQQQQQEGNNNNANSNNANNNNIASLLAAVLGNNNSPFNNYPRVIFLNGTANAMERQAASTKLDKDIKELRRRR